MFSISGRWAKWPAPRHGQALERWGSVPNWIWVWRLRFVLFPKFDQLWIEAARTVFFPPVSCFFFSLSMHMESQEGRQIWITKYKVTHAVFTLLFSYHYWAANGLPKGIWSQFLLRIGRKTWSFLAFNDPKSGWNCCPQDHMNERSLVRKNAAQKMLTRMIIRWPGQETLETDESNTRERDSWGPRLTGSKFFMKFWDSHIFHEFILGLQTFGETVTLWLLNVAMENCIFADN
jgi:hypothetical protein